MTLWALVALGPGFTGMSVVACANHQLKQVSEYF